LLREYTFLLDPPGFAATTAVEPAAAIPAQVLAPAASPAAPAAPTASRASQDTGADTYGPIKRGETLGKIAAQVKPETVTLEQMLTALYQANAQAFDGKNMNRLRAGQILTVPKSDEVAAIPNSEAKKEIRVQAADWRAYRDRLAGAVPGGEAQGARQVTGGRITTAVEDKVATAPGADKLRLSRSETTPGSAGAAGRAENTLAAQKAVAEANSRVADLEKLVMNLQRQLELKQSSLQALQLAAEQAKAASKGTAATASAAPAVTAPVTPVAPAAPAAPAQTISPTPLAPAPAPAPAPTPAAAAPPPAAAIVTPPAVTSASEPAKVEAAKAPTLAAADSSPTAPEKSDTKAADADAAAGKAEPVKKAPLRPQPSQNESSFFDDLMGNPLLLIGVAAAIVLGVVYWLLARRRRHVTTKFEDSIGAGTDIRTSTVFGNTGGGVVNTGDNSLVSDFSREGMGNIDTGEVDPIAEAEVYLAYGRDNQAEEILRDALGKTPDRQEIRLKLLEIYAQQNKPTAFETIAAELFASTKGSGDIWAKAAQLGRGIDPANPLYAAKAEEGGAVDLRAPAPASGHDRLPDSNMRVAAAVERSAFETDFELPEAPKKEMFVMPPALAPAERAPAVTAPATSSLSASLAAAAAASVAAAAASRASAVHERAPLDFKLDSGPDFTPQSPSPTMDFVTLDGPITLTGATTLSGPSTLSGVTLASPSSDIWGEKPVPAIHEKVPVAPPVRTDKLPELKHSDVITTPAVAALAGAGAAPVATGTVPRAPQPSGKLELDKLDLSFDPSRKPFVDPTPSVLDGQWHDAATKLDLAKAYQEMGDVEGAREILQEVMQEGDEQQKKEAQTFIAKLRA
jgi:pilus assembly protein FimV